MHELSIKISVKGAMTPDQIMNLKELLDTKVNNYLLTIPVHTPILSRETRELEDAY